MTHRYVVESVDRLTASTLHVKLQAAPGERPFPFEAGQYAAISFFHNGRPTPARCFSIVSPPTELGKLEFSMRARGHFTRAIARLQPGDDVDVRGPFGGFVFNLMNDAPAVFLAGGIGITPLLSMARYAAQVRAPNRITLLYSCQTQDDIPFYKTLVELKQSNKNFAVVFLISNGPTHKLVGQRVATGRLTLPILRAALGKGYSQARYYICGPPPFMHAATALLHSEGIPDNAILTEAFAQGPDRQTGKILSWPYNIYALGALGVALGSFTVMASDLIKTLPPATYLDPTSPSNQAFLSNSRQDDLDTLVNSLPPLNNHAPATAGALAAEKSGATANPNPSPAPVVSTPQPTPPPKQCTTQSGVTTCI